MVGIVGIVVIALFGTWLFMSIYEADTLRTEVSVARSRDAATIIKLAGQNDPVAEYELAHMYGAGDGMTKSEKEARKWLGRAALHGFTAAQYELGVGMRDGRGMIQDYQGAVKWLRLAAESGHSRAQFDLASMYRFGKGTATDKIRAYTWFNVAAAQGLQEAAIARDTLLHELSPGEVVQAQEEARRLSESQSDAPSAIK